MAALPARSLPAANPGPGLSGEPAGKTNILLVDDSPDKLLALDSVLSSLNENLVQAGSGKEALRLLLQKEFAVILLDVNMPVMDGFETAELIRQRPSTQSTPIIFITALSMTPEQIYRGYAYGAVDYLFTPVVPEVLRSKVGVFVDIQRKNLEIKRQAQELQKLNLSLRSHAGEIEGINKELEAFNYTISHDLRAPLRAIQGLSNALLEDHSSQMDATAQDYARRICNAATRMDALIQDLLAYSRVSRGAVDLKPVKMDDVIHDAVLQNEAVIEESRAAIGVQGPLPVVAGHAATLVAIFSNLVSNALKFVPPGTQPSICIRAEPKHDRVRFWVEDNGIGIAPEHRVRIFKVFERLHPAEAYPGTGIGLAIVHKAVERLNGQLGLESEVGKGTRFWIELPSVKDRL